MSARDGKPCVKCGANDWNKWGKCKQCVRAKDRRYHQANREKKRKSYQRWQEAAPEKKRESDRRWYSANRDKIIERANRWQKENPEKSRARKNQWGKDNPDKVNANGHRYRTRKTAAGGSYTAAEWRILCNQYGNKCLCCGRDDVRLTADHILPVAMGGSSNIDNIQPLCKSCNSRKSNRHVDYRTRPTLVRWIQRTLFD